MVHTVKPHLPIIASAAGRIRDQADDPRREAEMLLAHALGLERRSDLYVRDLSPSTDQLDAFERLVAERASGVPMAYVIGHADFYRDRFRVVPGVLIPRPETETLVEVALEMWGTDRERPGRILELGVGSGVVVVSLLRELTGATAVGVDISDVALCCARENADRLEVGDRLTLLDGDLFAPLDEMGGRGRVFFDIIVSNPPYVAAGDEIGDDVRAHEPPLALFAGDDGLDVIRRIVAGAPECLVPGGGLAVEIGETQGPAATALVRERAAFGEPRVVLDLAGKDRVVAARRREGA